VAAFLLFGCGGHPLERKLSGRWLGQEVEHVPDPILAAASGWARGTSFEFAHGTITVAIPAEEPRSGKYRVASANDKDVQLQVTRADGTVDRVQLKLDDERSLRWMLGDGRAVVMRRER
jgi:hypothetical protein